MPGSPPRAWVLLHAESSEPAFRLVLGSDWLPVTTLVPTLHRSEVYGDSWYYVLDASALAPVDRDLKEARWSSLGFHDLHASHRLFTYGFPIPVPQVAIAMESVDPPLLDRWPTTVARTPVRSD